MSKNDPGQAIVSLLETMQRLRAPGGCSWDAEQTPFSLAPYILEEACELIDAIECGEPERILDELGDLLLQIVFQADIFRETGQFGFADIADAINAKLIRRHPHVFQENDADLCRNDLDQQWHQIKEQEQNEDGRRHGQPDDLPKALPALQYTQKLLARLERQQQLDNQMLEVEPTSSARNEHSALGQELIKLVYRAHQQGIDAEQALRSEVKKWSKQCTEHSSSP